MSRIRLTYFKDLFLEGDFGIFVFRTVNKYQGGTAFLEGPCKRIMFCVVYLQGLFLLEKSLKKKEGDKYVRKRT